MAEEPAFPIVFDRWQSSALAFAIGTIVAHCGPPSEWPIIFLAAYALAHEAVQSVVSPN
jgi:hypothetical protein